MLYAAMGRYLWSEFDCIPCCMQQWDVTCGLSWIASHAVCSNGTFRACNQVDTNMTAVHTTVDMTGVHSTVDMTAIHTTVDMTAVHSTADMTAVHTILDMTAVHMTADYSTIRNLHAFKFPEER